MKKQMIKRILAFVLVAVLFLGVLPIYSIQVNADALTNANDTACKQAAGVVWNPQLVNDNNHPGLTYKGASYNTLNFATISKTATLVNGTDDTFDVNITIKGNKIDPAPYPCYTVLVLDVTSSMGTTTTTGMTRVRDLKNAVNSFITSYLVSSSPNNYLSIIVYRGNYGFMKSRSGTTYSGSSFSGWYNYTSAITLKNLVGTGSDTITGLVDSMNIYDAAGNLVSNLGSTNIEAGLAGAIKQLNGIAMPAGFEADVNNSSYNVVLMTDGEANISYNNRISLDTWSNVCSYNSTATVNLDNDNRALNMAKILKNGPNAGGKTWTPNIYTVLFGSSGATLMQNIAKEGKNYITGSNPPNNYYTVSDSSGVATNIFDSIRKSIDSPTIVNGILTDIVPKGYDILSVKAYIYYGDPALQSEITLTSGVNYTQTPNTDGSTTIQWSNIPSRGENQTASLIIKIQAETNCSAYKATDYPDLKNLTSSTTNHNYFYTNKGNATLRYWNVIKPNTNPNDYFEVGIQSPVVHVPKPGTSVISIEKKVYKNEYNGRRIPTTGWVDETDLLINQTALFKITIKNTGELDATNVKLTDVWDGDDYDNGLTWSLNNVPVNPTETSFIVPAKESVVFYATTIAKGDYKLVNTATLITDDEIEGNGYDSATVNVRVPKLPLPFFKTWDDDGSEDQIAKRIMKVTITNDLDTTKYELTIKNEDTTEDGLGVKVISTNIAGQNVWAVIISGLPQYDIITGGRYTYTISEEAEGYTSKSTDCGMFNINTQKPKDVYIDITKILKIDERFLKSEMSGKSEKVLVCKHEHDDDCYILDCNNEEEDHEHDDNCYVLDCKHEHDDTSCYETQYQYVPGIDYGINEAEFTFEITVNGKLFDTKTIKFGPGEEEIPVADGASDCTATIEILSSLYSHSGATIVITEVMPKVDDDDLYGWVPEEGTKSIVLDKFGNVLNENVIVNDGVINVEFTNVYGATPIHYIIINKLIYNTRWSSLVPMNIPGASATFEVNVDGYDSPYRTVTIDKFNLGFGSAMVILPRGKTYEDVEVIEINSKIDAGENWEYGKQDEEGISCKGIYTFQNFYEEIKIPSITIQKEIKVLEGSNELKDADIPDFKFGVFDEKGNQVGEDKIEGKDFVNGKASVEVTLNAYKNKTAVLTVKEIDDNNDPVRWVYNTENMEYTVSILQGEVVSAGYWTPRMIWGVNIPAYNTVDKDNLEFKNTYNEVYPEFDFDKVVTTRTGSSNPAPANTTFNFELREGSTVIDRISITNITQGASTVKSRLISLPRYTNANAELTLREIIPTNRGNWTYDAAVFTITIVNGRIDSIVKPVNNQTTTVERISFANEYYSYTPPPPPSDTTTTEEPTPPPTTTTEPTTQPTITTTAIITTEETITEATTEKPVVEPTTQPTIDEPEVADITDVKPPLASFEPETIPEEEPEELPDVTVPLVSFEPEPEPETTTEAPAEPEKPNPKTGANVLAGIMVIAAMFVSAAAILYFEKRLNRVK